MGLPLGLIAPHPIELHQIGPRLVAPANYTSSDVPQPVLAYHADVRVASNLADVPVSKRAVQLNDVIVVVNEECGASPANATKYRV